MKRILGFITACTILISLTACGNNNKKAFTVSKEAYDEITAAYEISDSFGSDIYEAWRLGIYHDDEILKEGTSYLVSELNISEDELIDGVAYTLLEITDSSWESASDDEKEKMRSLADTSFLLFEDELFSYCVQIVANAYRVSGKADEAQTALNSAKSLMKELSEKYSDYEHYPNLKNYYTSTKSFFDFCQSPTGSFEQVKTTINDYRNDIRSYISDLDYIFEE